MPPGPAPTLTRQWTAHPCQLGQMVAQQVTTVLVACIAPKLHCVWHLGRRQKVQCMQICVLLLVTQGPQWGQCLQVTCRALPHLRQQQVRPLCTRRPPLGLNSPRLTLQTLLSPWSKLPQSHQRQPSHRQPAAFLQVGCLAPPLSMALSTDPPVLVISLLVLHKCLCLLPVSLA